MLDLSVKVKVKGQVDLGVIKYVKLTSSDPMTSKDHKLGQTDYKGHRDLWGHKVGHSDL